MKKSDAEYIMLREEIMYIMKKRDDYTKFLYTIVIAIWTAAITIDSKWIALLGLIIILPISFRLHECIHTNATLSAYMIVFLENESSYIWERNSHNYKSSRKTNFALKLIRYVGRADSLMLGIISIILFWFLSRPDILVLNSKFITGVFAVVQIVILISIGCLSVSNTRAEKYKNDYIKKWSTLKRK